MSDKVRSPEMEALLVFLALHAIRLEDFIMSQHLTRRGLLKVLDEDVYVQALALYAEVRGISNKKFARNSHGEAVGFRNH